MLGVSESRVESVWRALAAILHLGELKFKKTGNGSAIDDQGALERCASVLGVPAGELAYALEARVMSVRGQETRIPLSPQEARDAANALAKGLYDRLFQWLVKTMNRKLSPGIAENSKSFIGILDIFGFESNFLFVSFGFCFLFKKNLISLCFIKYYYYYHYYYRFQNQ